MYTTNNTRTGVVGSANDARMGGCANSTDARTGGCANSTDARELSRIKIYKHIANGVIFEIYDMLSVESKYNKVAFSLITLDEQKHMVTRVRHYVDVDDIKLVCLDLLIDKFVEFRDYKGSRHIDYSEARTLTLAKSSDTSSNVVLRIENGVGDIQANGAIRMERVTDAVSIELTEWEMRKIAIVLRDYIEQWELIHFRSRRDAMTFLLPPYDSYTDRYMHETID